MEACRSVPVSRNFSSKPIYINNPVSTHCYTSTQLSKSLDGALSIDSNLGNKLTKPISIGSSRSKCNYSSCSPKEQTSSTEGRWFSEAIAELHLSNMSPRSDTWTDELRSRRSSMDPDLILSEEEEDLYLNSKTSQNEEDPEVAVDLLEANAMYFLSQDSNDYEPKYAKNKGLRNKLLNVLQTEKIRDRSASYGDVSYKSPDPSTSPVKKMRSLFTRVRSQSQGDIVIPATFKVKTAINEVESEEEDNVANKRVSSLGQSSDCDKDTPSATNVSMMKKFKRGIKKAPGKLFPSGSRRNSTDPLSPGKSLSSSSRRNSADVLFSGKVYQPSSRRNSTDILSNIKSIFEEPNIEPSNSVEDIPGAISASERSSFSQISDLSESSSAMSQQSIPVIFIDNSVCDNESSGMETNQDCNEACTTDHVIIDKENLESLKPLTEFNRNSSESNLLRPPLRRLRSKSDPSITVDENFKRREKWEPKFVAKLKEKHRQWKKHRGSLPDVLWGNQSSSENSSRSASRRNSGNKVSKSKKGLLGVPIASNLLNITSSVVFQDLINHSNSSENLDLPEEEDINPYRGKSRSVDHTLQRPFDLDLLRKKIGERTSSEPLRDAPPSWTDPDANRGNGTPEKRGGTPQTLLSGPTITYTVQPNDTLMSIAARFETTPSELTKLNRLSTRFLFPGQLLLVPDRGGAKENLGGENGTIKDCRTSPYLSDLAPPLTQQSRNSAATPTGHVENERSLDKECLEKFLKIQVRHITDGQGVVAGVLLVTPNAVMFDPNVSDPLVIDRGPESYGVIAPMDLVVNAALYYDIAHMKVKDTVLPRPDIPKPEIFWGPPVSRPNSTEDQLDALSTSNELLQASDSGVLSGMGGSEESPSKDCPYPELAPLDNDNDSSCSCGGETRETSAFPKAFEHEILTPISSDVSPTGGEVPPVSDSGSLLQGLPQVPSPVIEQDDILEEDTSLILKEDSQPVSSSPASSPQLPRPISPQITQPDSLQMPRPASPQMPRPASPQIHIAQNQSQLCDTKASASSSFSSPMSSSQDLHAQTVCQKMPLNVSSSVPLTNDKKRTTSVTFSTSSESDMPPLPEDGSELPLHESRKQKVLKRISYPLSWMESFGADKDGHMMNLQQQTMPSSAPPSGNWAAGPGVYPGAPGMEAMEGGRPGMFSNVFSISNVSNMLTSSPKYLVDFSSGLFTRSPSETSGGSGSIRDLPDACPPQAIPRPLQPLHQSSSSTSSSPSPTPSFFPTFSRKQVVSPLDSDKEKRASAHGFIGRPSLDNFKRPAPPQPVGDPLMSASLHANMGPPNSLGELDSDSNVQAHKRAQFKEGPKYGLKSMVSVDDMPDLFASFDKLIPKPASSSEVSPLYLCLRMGTPLNKPIPRTTPIMTYGKKTMKPEYWFSIPKDRTNELFHFFQIWANHLYGELDEEAVKARGFNLIEEEVEIWSGHIAAEGEDGGFGAAGELKEMTKESWEKIKAPYAKLYSIVKSGMTISLESENQEVVSMSEDLRKALYSSASLTSLDIEVFLPEVQGVSEVIDDSFRKNMFKKLPARVQGYNWRLVFSTAEHGFSLKTLYRKMSDIDSPVIVFIQDTLHNKFGALVSCPLRVSDLFYGTGESFMFVCQPEFQIFPWTGENTFFVKGNNESLYIGGGDGRFGIWLDGDLYQGRTQPCKTYGNPVLSSSEDFIIKTVECWYFD